ncbi:hypothetical protein [Serratia ureilytica]|uniref:hypothetical protein n=1 Tax=Serratia ureilytica TaxID=300181 RepID=UPI003FA7AC66
MDNKPSELSKPVAWTDERGNLCTNRNKERGLDSRYHQDYEKYTTPFYSQEYVSALIQRAERLDSMLTESVQALKAAELLNAELEQAMRHIHGALLDITVPRVAIAKAAELAVEHAAMKEKSNG